MKCPEGQHWPPPPQGFPIDASVEVASHSFVPQRLAIMKRTPSSAIRRMRFSSEHDPATRDLISYAETYLLKSTHTESHTDYIVQPDGWFQHLKAEHAPRWFLDRFPIKTKKIGFTYNKHTHICPHDNSDWPDPSHIRFLEYMEKPYHDYPEVLDFIAPRIES